MSKFQLKKIAFALSLSTALSVHAAGLGTMISSSKLGEPLNAEIELLAVTPSELTSIQAALANEQVYQDQMLEKPASYPFIKIDVGNNSKGQPVLKLTSTQPITEAFLDMLIQVDWPTGRLVKEYTLLLDPPGFNSNYVSESAGLPVASQPEPTATLNKPVETNPDIDVPSQEVVESKKTSKSSSAKSEPKATPVDTSAASVNSLTTERGDTLYAIARQLKPDNVSTEQMLAALYQANQQAFSGKNMNRLKVGKIIKLPDQATIDSMSKQQAKSLVAEHASNWQAYKNSLAKVVKESEPVNAGGNTQQSAGKIGSANEKPVPPTKDTKDVLKLSAGDEKSTTLADKATAAKEEATAKENAIKEEQDRAAALEKQVADMKKLMEMKNNALAQAEANAAQTSETKPEENKAPEAATPIEETPADPANVESEPTPQDKPAAEQPVAAPVIEEAAEPPSFMHVLVERLKHISPLLPWALLALPLLLAVWAIIRIRRKKQIDNFEDAIVTSPATELQNNTVFGDTQAAAASGDTSFLTDFSQSGVGGMIDSNDVDPIAEAEVYMAYGRDAQAEEILKDAIQKDPARQELKLKLLEIYQATANKEAFQAVASEINETVGANDPAWAKAAAMGQKLDPENAMYQTTAVASPAASAEQAESVPVAEIEAATDEEAYHFNFETPALEFEGASAAVAAASESTDELKDASELESIAKEVDDFSVELTSDLEPSADTLQDKSKTDSTQVPTKGEDELELSPALSESQPPKDGAVSGFEVVEENQVDQISLEASAELTPKSLDLPSLNLDEGIEAADQAEAPVAQPVSGEAKLSSEDAVFESLPELSLELGGPNDMTNQADGEGSFDIDEITLGSADETLNEMSVSAETPDDLAFPEISLDVADGADNVAASADVASEEPEEVNTKLDLIQAYIDMEDVIGAKELIDEVLAEGGERQRQLATELLAKIA